MNTKNLALTGYESPKCSILHVDSECVLCTSGDAGYNATTEDVVVKELEW